MLTFKYDDDVQITPHFNSREFRCKCGTPHDFQVSEDLVNKLEVVYKRLNCSKIIISSGFRCVKHDKSVGGSGTGQHTLGRAADYCCYGQDGNIISSKLVCCTAQDVGFTGIANINANYTYTHSDVRTSGKWFGNEITGYNSVTTDFYQYFGIQKEESHMNGIDISYCQTKINWDQLNVDFVIIKAGQKDYTDPWFERHYAAAEKAGIPKGAYWYGEAKTVDAAKKEADCFIERLNGKKFEYPVYYDVEGDMLNLSNSLLSDIVKAFLERVERAGYWVGLYMSGCPMHDKISSSVLSRFALWVADTRGAKPTYIQNYGIWQYSHTGKVASITGDVDLDYGYVDYPSKIKAKGLNGFASSNIPTDNTPTDTSNQTDNGDDSNDKPTNEVEDIDVEVVINGKKYEGKLSEKK